MKRAVLCVPNPQDYLDQLNDYSVMIVNPASAKSRIEYLLGHADWSVLITADQVSYQNGGNYPNEKLFWYTSGTTGDSKFCSFSQDQLDRMCDTIKNAYDLTANDRYVSIMPLWHAHGQGFYWATKKLGCETQFVNIKNIKHLPKLSPTFITAIPDFLKTMVNLKFESLRFIRSASAPLTDSLFRDLNQRHRVPIIEAFGMTESLSHCFSNPLQGEQRMGTVGLPDGIQAEIRDSHLYIKGPCLFQPDWYDTGDLAEQDQKGYYKILGRSRDQINVRGIKINPVSLEKQLKESIENLGDCVVFGSSAVKCLITGDCQKSAVEQFLNGLGTHCRPVFLEKIDTIPLSPAGKISRSWLDKTFI
jgi:acyl-coenzyme A synthetase/AMP-(fatty) acid ligase